MSDKYESLKDKLFKLKALAERGVGGEADNARRLLLKLCADNGIDLSDLDATMSPKDTLFKVGRSPWLKELIKATAATFDYVHVDGVKFMGDPKGGDA